MRRYLGAVRNEEQCLRLIPMASRVRKGVLGLILAAVTAHDVQAKNQSEFSNIAD